MKFKKRIPKMIGITFASMFFGFFSFLILTQWIRLIHLNGPNHALQQFTILTFLWATIFNGSVFKTEQSMVWLMIKIVLFSSIISIFTWLVFRSVIAWGFSRMP